MLQMSYLGLGAASNPAVARLQRALILLGMAVKDTKLAIKADGITGPATAAAANRALTAHVAGAPAQYRTGKLTAAQVASAAAALSALVEAEISRRGTGAKPAAAKVSPVAKATPAQIKALEKKLPKAAPAKPVPATSIAALQNALRELGAKVKDSTLSAIKSDGLIGPKTISATNRALSKYATNAAPQYRTGKLTGTEIVAMAAGLADMIRATPVAGKPGAAPAGKPGKNQDVAQVQTLLVQLAKAVPDKALAVTVDGLIGPKTAAAANRALKMYATMAAPTLRTGGLTTAQVVANAKAIADALAAAVASKGARPVKAQDVTATKKLAPAAAASALVKRMQKLTVQLAGLTADNALKIAVDGKMGPKTAAAVNRALSKYATSAAPMLRTGGLTPASLVAQAKAVNKALKDAIASRGQAPVEPTPDEAVAETSPIPGETGPSQIPGMAPPAAEGPMSPTLPGQMAPGPAPTAAMSPGGGEAPGGGGGGGVPSGGGGGGMAPSPGGGEAPAPGGEQAPGGETAPGAETPGLSTAAKVGIGVGAAALLGTIGYFVFRKKPGPAHTRPSRTPHRRLRTA